MMNHGKSRVGGVCAVKVDHSVRYWPGERGSGYAQRPCVARCRTEVGGPHAYSARPDEVDRGFSSNRRRQPTSTADHLPPTSRRLSEWKFIPTASRLHPD